MARLLAHEWPLVVKAGACRLPQVLELLGVTSCAWKAGTMQSRVAEIGCSWQQGLICGGFEQMRELGMGGRQRADQSKETSLVSLDVSKACCGL